MRSVITAKFTRKTLALATAILAVASVLVGFQITTSSSQDSADALSGSSFNAGNIISDDNFYDGTSLTQAQVQTFLSNEVGTCKSSSCLSNGSFSLDSHSADAMCSALTGGSGLSAAAIITRVGKACDISPKVIIVTLQKEQALITGTTAQNPSSATLARAMGYACPDTTNGACDTTYAGVGNQIYWAAWQWQRYGNPSGTSKYFTWYSPGSAHAIAYSPTASCGTKTVTVQNKATAALYYYTPYTPNAAALNNLYGTGDSCSAYGNRNFWRMYTEWFGSPTGKSTTAMGHLDSVKSPGYNSVKVTGWAADSTSKSSTKVKISVGTASTTVTASSKRADVAKAYPAIGSAHGFSATIDTSGGSKEVCAEAYDTSNATSKSLGCSTVTVAEGSPHGAVDSVEAVPGGLRVRGWAIDPETSSPIRVHVYSDGKAVKGVTANETRADVGESYPSAGSAHGFDTTVALAKGTHKICVYGINVDAGSNARLASCTSVGIPGSSPVGSLDSASTGYTSLTVSGWTLDGDTTSSISAHVYIDGKGHALKANKSRSDIAKRYPAYGSAHGYSGTFTVSKGSHKVCVYGINAGASAPNSTLGCTTVSTTNTKPVGSVDSVKAVSGGLSVGGWALDTDTPTTALSVHVYIDGENHRVIANGKRADVGRAYPAAGANHGYSSTFTVSKGSHKVCIYAIDSDSGAAHTTLGCKTVTTS